VNRLLSEDNLVSFSNILTNVEAITAAVDVSELDASKLNDMMDSITAAADAIESTAKAYEVTSEQVNIILQVEGVDGTLGTVNTTLTDFSSTAVAVDALMADAQVAINRLSNSGLSDVEDTLSAVRELVTTLGRVADSLEQNPTQLFVGTKRDTVELPQ